VRIVTRQRAFSSAKARRLLGYTPATPLQEGVRRTVAAFAHLRADAGAGDAAAAAAAKAR
jgi:nucleoside-diphosphate-sugar epimerase